MQYRTDLHLTDDVPISVKEQIRMDTKRTHLVEELNELNELKGEENCPLNPLKSAYNLKQKEYKEFLLERFLLNYALRNPRIGYCQGLSYVAHALLLKMGGLQYSEEMEDAEDAEGVLEEAPNAEEIHSFYTFCWFIEDFQPADYYTDLDGLLVDKMVFYDFLRKKKPDLVDHMAEVCGFGEMKEMVFFLHACTFVVFLTSNESSSKI